MRKFLIVVCVLLIIALTASVHCEKRNLTSEIPTEYLEGVAIRLSEARHAGYLHGCNYAIGNLEIRVDKGNSKWFVVSLKIDDTTLERLVSIEQ